MEFLDRESKDFFNEIIKLLTSLDIEFEVTPF